MMGTFRKAMRGARDGPQVWAETVRAEMPNIVVFA